ncbi:DNA-binding response regulator [Rhodococcus sp. 15-649-1-2]|nr:response regulator [Rhodococcus sp. 15-649-1-2]OZE83399.1 DNA-binding response regulator [Rhodococcus sp. 15-649-1-2]
MTESPSIRILVVEDEPQIVRALRINLKVRGYDVVAAASGAEALRVAADFHPEVVLLDLGLPDFDGVEVIGGLRGWTDVPIVVLSARTDSADTVDALDAGADDFVTKPFEMDVLLARLRAALRRGQRAVEDAVVETDSFTVDLSSKTVTRGGDVVHLTRTEWGVLELLARNRGKLVSQREILKTVWGPKHERETHYLRIYLAQLRQKLEDDPSRPRHLLTETGMGYRLK